MIGMNPITIKCKRCNRPAKSTEFVLDNVYRMMVCPACVKERRSGIKNTKDSAKEVKKEIKPAGWDNDDLYLEKAYQEKMKKQESKPKIERLPNGKMRYTCTYCNYRFTIDDKERASCPYCGNPAYVR